MSLVLILLALAIAATAVIWQQARRTPAGPAQYVALGSSFAAGAGLGPLQDESPWLCARSVNGYPRQLAARLNLSLVDMSCGGAKTRHLLSGGQFFQGPQIRVINRDTRLVTFTVGGNDIGYIGDLSMLAARHSDTLFGRLVRLFWSGPLRPQQRDHHKLRNDLLSTIRAIRNRAPDAQIVLVTYPTILPPAGTCSRLGLTEAEAVLMRQVGDAFAATTRAAAERGGARVVDMHNLGAAHHACSGVPWTDGWWEVSGAPFHPTLTGARATAEQILMTIDLSRLGRQPTVR